MNIVTGTDVIPSLYKGEKLTTETFMKNGGFFFVEDGLIIDNNGNEVNVMGIDEPIFIYEPPVEKDDEVETKEVLSKQDALQALYRNKKVRPVSSEFFLEVIDGQIVDNDGSVFNIMSCEHEEWVVVNDEVDFSKFATKKDIGEIKSLIKKLEKTLKAKTNDGRGTQNQEETNELLMSVYDRNNRAEVKELFEEKLRECKDSRDIQKVITEFIPYCWIGSKSVNYIANLYSSLREIVKRSTPKQYQDMALILLSPPQSFYENRRDKIEEVTKAKHVDRDYFDKDNIEDVVFNLKEMIVRDDEVEFSKLKTRQNKDIGQVKTYIYAIYLALVTSRRMVEILKTLEIVKIKGIWYYKGIAKKGKEEVVTVEAYSLDKDYEFLAKILKYVQDYLQVQEWDSTQVNSKYNNTFNNALKRYTKLSYSFKDLREISAHLVYLRDGKKDGTWNEEKAFTSKVLGHEPSADRLTASEHYMTKETR